MSAMPAMAPGTDEILLDATGCTKRFGGSRRRARHRLRDPAWRHRQPDRPQRRRQDDVLQHDHRPVRPDRGQDRLRRQGHHRQEAARGGPRRHRPHVPEHPAVRQHDRRGERARRAAPPAQGPLVRRDLENPRHPQRGRAGARARRDPPRPRRAPASARTPSAATCPTATSGVSRSRVPWRPTRSCCCSTSRPPG